MAYIVLAAGAVMAVLGALAIMTGYPIIQIERGWATVIAGTTLLAGGMITMALGVAVRALMDVRTILASHPSVSSNPPASDPYAAPYTEPSFSSEPRPEPDEHASTYGATAVGAAAVAVPIAALALTGRHEPEPHLPAPHLAEPHLPEEGQAHRDAIHEPVGHTHLDDAPVPVEHEPGSPPMDDWLDRAFADLALEKTPPAKDVDGGPSTQVEPEPLRPEHEAPERGTAGHIDARHDGEILYADAHEAAVAAPEPLDHHDETVHDLAHHEAEYDVDHAGHVSHDEPAHAPVEHDLEPMTAPAPVAPDGPAVIGRYEADGTAYTMYADGSIEAQSDAGIYRFASMADLKAFIEG